MSALICPAVTQARAAFADDSGVDDPGRIVVRAGLTQSARSIFPGDQTRNDWGVAGLSTGVPALDRVIPVPPWCLG